MGRINKKMVGIGLLFGVVAIIIISKSIWKGLALGLPIIFIWWIVKSSNKFLREVNKKDGKNK